jgi:hypothetical protein
MSGVDRQQAKITGVGAKLYIVTAHKAVIAFDKEKCTFFQVLQGFVEVDPFRREKLPLHGERAIY